MIFSRTEHHVFLIMRRFSCGTDCLGAISLLRFLVFVIFTFFKEGIGNILTMPLGSWVLEMGLGTWDLWDGNNGNWESPFGSVYQSKTLCS